MGGGKQNPIGIKDEEHDVVIIKDEDDNVNPLDSQVAALGLVDNKPVLVDDLAPDNVPLPKEKIMLMRELKALGCKPMVKPDYTKPLDEPSWGEEDDEEDDDFEVDEEEVDEMYELYEHHEMEEMDIKSEVDSDVEME